MAEVKKPVNLGFLDFSTRVRRRAAFRREVELNRRLAPDVDGCLRQVARLIAAFHAGADLGRRFLDRYAEFAVQSRPEPWCPPRPTASGPQPSVRNGGDPSDE